MKNLFSIALMLTFIVFSSCVTTGIKELESQNPIGKTFRDNIQLGNKTIPLPEGEWKVIGRSKEYGDDKYFIVILINEIKDNILHDLVYIKVDTPQNKYTGYKVSKYCQRNDVLYVNAYKNVPLGHHDCWLINHYRLSFSAKNEATKQAHNYLKDRNIITPNYMIQSWHFLTGKYGGSKYAVVHYFYNPEYEGFDPAPPGDWATSPWHVLHINSDPNKVKYIEKIKKEGESLHNKFRVGFGN